MLSLGRTLGALAVLGVMVVTEARWFILSAPPAAGRVGISAPVRGVGVRWRPPRQRTGGSQSSLPLSWLPTARLFARWGRRPRPPLTAMRGAWLGQGQGSRPRLFCYSLPIPGARSTGHPVGQALLVPTPGRGSPTSPPPLSSLRLAVLLREGSASVRPPPLCERSLARRRQRLDERGGRPGRSARLSSAAFS